MQQQKPEASQRLIYLNNAATSFPKPPPVLDAVQRALQTPACEPGRAGGHDSVVSACRRACAQLFGVNDVKRVALLPSATHAINTVVNGLVSGPGHVVTTVLEHNSVLRPLQHAAHRYGLDVSFVAPDASGVLNPAAIKAVLRQDTLLVAVTHASNVSGSIVDIESICAICAAKNVPVLVDASQSAASVELDTSRLQGRVYVAIAGHKGLLGPVGIGILLLADAELEQSVVGGTGVRSASDRHPAELPLRHEAGSPNLLGCAGLEAGIAWVMQHGVRALGEKKHALVTHTRELLAWLPGLHVLGLANDDGRTGIVSFWADAQSSESMGYALQSGFDICTRWGLHCAPQIHRALGLDVQGTVRVSYGPFNSDDDVVALARALGEILP